MFKILGSVRSTFHSPRFTAKCRRFELETNTHPVYSSLQVEDSSLLMEDEEDEVLSDSEPSDSGDEFTVDDREDVEDLQDDDVCESQPSAPPPPPQLLPPSAEDRKSKNVDALVRYLRLFAF